MLHVTPATPPAADGVATTLNIAEMANLFGVTHRTLRFYERRGLLAPARVRPGHRGAPLGHRRYDARDIRRMGLVGRYKALGLDLDAIAAQLRADDSCLWLTAAQRDAAAARLDRAVDDAAQAREWLRGAVVFWTAS